MRAAIGLVALGLIAGVVPTGFPGIPYAVQVLAGAAGALFVLLAGCLAGASLARRPARSAASAARRLRPGRIASAHSSSRSM